MSWKDVSTEVYDAVKNNKIDLGKCPKCPVLGGEIIICKEAYGRNTNTVRVKCRNCGYETEAINATVAYHDAKTGRIGTFVTTSSLITAMRKAIRIWNEKGKE